MFFFCVLTYKAFVFVWKISTHLSSSQCSLLGRVMWTAKIFQFFLFITEHIHAAHENIIYGNEKKEKYIPMVCAKCAFHNLVKHPTAISICHIYTWHITHTHTRSGHSNKWNKCLHIFVFASAITYEQHRPIIVNGHCWQKFMNNKNIWYGNIKYSGAKERRKYVAIVNMEKKPSQITRMWWWSRLFAKNKRSTFGYANVNLPSIIRIFSEILEHKPKQ